MPVLLLCTGSVLIPIFRGSILMISVLSRLHPHLVSFLLLLEFICLKDTCVLAYHPQIVESVLLGDVGPHACFPLPPNKLHWHTRCLIFEQINDGARVDFCESSLEI